MPTLTEEIEAARDMVRWHNGELRNHMEGEDWDLAAWSARDLETWLRRLNGLLNLMADKEEVQP